MESLAEAFDAIRGLPSWHVRRGHGSFVTMEFGEPRLEIDDTVRAKLAYIAGERVRVPQRGAHVRGEWHLWIYCCEWSLSWRGRPLAHSESPDIGMDRALSVLNGQTLANAEVADGDGSSSFAFDLDCVLSTRPTDVGEPDVEQWMFFQPNGQVLSLHASGRLHTGAADEPRDEHG